MSSSVVMENRTHIMQGSFAVSGDPVTMLTTVLGSCVAVCLRDPIAKVGGMNHFLLPEADNSSGMSGSAVYGIHLMEVLVNGLLNLGADKTRLEAKVFGGANMVKGLGNIGSRNVEFAINFLEGEGIKYMSGDHGGDSGRRIQYWPVSGRARQRLMLAVEEQQVEQNQAAPVDTSGGDLELF